MSFGRAGPACNIAIACALALGLWALFADTASAGCAELSICGKTVVARLNGGGTVRAYVSTNGDVFATLSGETITNRKGSNFLGTTCSASGATTTVACPGPNCTNTYRGSRDHTSSSTETTSCRVSYTSDSFVLTSQISTQMSQNMNFAGQPHQQSSTQEITSEERLHGAGRRLLGVDQQHQSHDGLQHLDVSDQHHDAPLQPNPDPARWRAAGSCSFANGDLAAGEWRVSRIE